MDENNKIMNKVIYLKNHCKSVINPKYIIRDILFFLIAFLLVFDEIPEAIQLKMLGGPLEDDAVVYPLIAGLIYSGYKYYHGKLTLYSFSRFKWFVFFFIGASLLSLIVGLVQYPFYTEIVSSPEIKSHIFSYFPLIADMLHLPYEDTTAIGVLFFIRSTKNILLYALYIWGGSYMIYCWYHEEFKRGLKVFCLGCMASLSIFLVIGFLNLCALTGNIEVKTFLYSDIYPYILRETRVIVNGVYNYRPNQIRSILPEPSHIGNYYAAILPTLLLGFSVYKTKISKIFFGICLLVTAFMGFMGQSRTPMGIMVGIFILFIIGSLLQGRDSWKRILPVAFITIISFGVSIIFINSFVSVEGGDKSKSQSTVVKYAEANLISLNLNDTSKRSNSARKAYIMIHLREGMDHPLLGVGPELSPAYNLQYVTADEMQDREVHKTVIEMKNRGIISGTYNMSAQNEFAQRFSENGILGLIIFCFPFLYILWHLFLLIIQYRNHISESHFLLWAFIAVFAGFISGANGYAVMMYNVWPILGLAYSIYDKFKIIDKDNL